MKLAADKVARDLAQVSLIEASLKAKKWDTTNMVKYLKEQAEGVKKHRDDLFNKWVLMKQDVHDTITEAELKQKTAEANDLTKGVLDAFKTFAKDTLSEFRP